MKHICKFCSKTAQNPDGTVSLEDSSGAYFTCEDCLHFQRSQQTRSTQVPFLTYGACLQAGSEHAVGPNQRHCQDFIHRDFKPCETCGHFRSLDEHRGICHHTLVARLYVYPLETCPRHIDF